MRGQYEELPCPFCDRGRIQAWYIPAAISQRSRISSTFGKIKERKKSPDVWLIKSGCNVCGKSQEEVEKELKRQNII